ncbi:MAG: hypothetical protein JW943_14620 [Deltaproteobacteria bacterium]|nr:hypothetical protein [Deltaproteobacteria bacterium]
MGKGLILSGGADGKYRIRLLLATQRINGFIAKLNADIAALQALLPVITSQINALQGEISALEAQVKAWETEDPEKYATQIINALTSITQKKTSLLAITGKKSYTELQITGLQKRIDYLIYNAPQEPEIDAWCADYTEDLTGNVGTIEVPGERGEVMIQPGFEDNAEYDPSRDGQLQPSIAGTPESVFWNFALLPGWQKWKPTYRTGTITWKDGDKCNVDLDEARSSVKNLNVNQSNNLENVDIEYMTCNGSAFAVGDDVIVEFTGQDWNNPKVVGFAHDPRPCGEFAVFRISWGGDGTQTVVVWDIAKNEARFTPRSVTDEDYAAWIANKNEAPNVTALFEDSSYVYRAPVSIMPDSPATQPGTSYNEVPAATDVWGEFTDWYLIELYAEGTDPVQKNTCLINVYGDVESLPPLTLSAAKSAIELHGEEPFGLRLEYSYTGFFPEEGGAFDYDYTIEIKVIGPFGQMHVINAETSSRVTTEYRYVTHKDLSKQDYATRLKSQGYKSDRSVVNVIFHQFRIHDMAYKYLSGSYWDMTDEPAGPVVKAVQAQALDFPAGYAGEDLLPYGNNEALSAAIEEAIDLFYSMTGNDISDVRITAEIVR